MNEIHVVTVFLYHTGKIALVRRSARVGTYQGRWSGISGYLEGDPDEHFPVEIAEETSLQRGDYTLLRKAEPVCVLDEELGRKWMVHPFLCEVADPSRITLDWENLELKWVAPLTIREINTVPGLWEVYETVSEIALENEISAFVQQLKEDKTSGARQLALFSLNFIANLCRISNAAKTEVLIADIARANDRIRSVRPSMIIIDTTLELLMRDIPRYRDISEAQSGIRALVQWHREELESAVEKSIEHLKDIIPDGAKVLLHSYSSSIEKALLILKDKGCSLVITESRPGLEGRRTATQAAELSLNVELITDASLFHILKDVDIVLMGADGIEKDGTVINKMGSAMIAWCAQALGAKVYILAERRKITLRDEAFPLEEGDPYEVWDSPPSGVSVKNIYFEKVPPACICWIILERGVVKPQEIMQMTV
jgi:translation initiation factor 2B subunit (eIF-2B alpha/beta/delta family)